MYHFINRPINFPIAIAAAVVEIGQRERVVVGDLPDFFRHNPEFLQLRIIQERLIFCRFR